MYGCVFVRRARCANLDALQAIDEHQRTSIVAELLGDTNRENNRKQ